MRAFAEAFPSFSIPQRLAKQAQIPDPHQLTIVQQAAAQLPWGHIQVLLDKVKQPEQMAFYVQHCIENG